MSHAFATHPRERNFHTAAIADNALVFDTLIFPARAFPIAGRTKNSLTEKTTLLRLKGSVIDCLRVFDFAFAP